MSTNVVKTANTVAKNANTAQQLLMDAYELKDDQVDQAQTIARKSGAFTETEIKSITPQSLRIIAQQKYQDSSSMLNLFSTLIQKMGEIKDRIIQNIGR